MWPTLAYIGDAALEVIAGVIKFRNSRILDVFPQWRLLRMDIAR